MSKSPCNFYFYTISGPIGLLSIVTEMEKNSINFKHFSFDILFLKIRYVSALACGTPGTWLRTTSVENRFVKGTRGQALYNLSSFFQSPFASVTCYSSVSVDCYDSVAISFFWLIE